MLSRRYTIIPSVITVKTDDGEHEGGQTNFFSTKKLQHLPPPYRQESTHTITFLKRLQYYYLFTALCSYKT